MNTEQRSPQFLRKRKFFTVLPALALPFLTLFFWALGGGGQVNTATAKSSKGLNFQLPGANDKADSTMNKMSYYDQAAQDSAKLNEQKKNDPYYRGDQVIAAADNSGFATSTGNGVTGLSGNYAPGNSFGVTNPNEKRIYQKLNQLNTALAQNPEGSSPKADYRYAAPGNTGVSSGDIDRLERMMQAMNQPTEQDPEMQQLNGVLEKLVEVQNPGLVQEKLRQTSEQRKGRVFAISSGKTPDPVSTLDKDRKEVVEPAAQPGNGFYSFDQQPAGSDSQNAVQAVIHETQTIVSGSTVKLRLANDIYINGVLIPKETFVFGTAALNGERLAIKINSIRYRSDLFPVELAVFDMDGLDGLYIPGAIAREVAKDGADRSMQNLGLNNTLDPSLGMQAATMGIETAKSLFSKKVKLVRVTVKAGYQVLLRDEKQKQQN